MKMVYTGPEQVYWPLIFILPLFTLSTHNCGGLSILDIELARKIDEYAALRRAETMTAHAQRS
jgi:hypothetical protein